MYKNWEMSVEKWTICVEKARKRELNFHNDCRISKCGFCEEYFSNCTDCQLNGEYCNRSNGTKNVFWNIKEELNKQNYGNVIDLCEKMLNKIRSCENDFKEEKEEEEEEETYSIGDKFKRDNCEYLLTVPEPTCTKFIMVTLLDGHICVPSDLTVENNNNIPKSKIDKIFGGADWKRTHKAGEPLEEKKEERYSIETARVGDLVEWEKTLYNYTARKGARAVVISIDGEYIDIKWIDKFGSGLRDEQEDGSYSPNNFNLIQRDYKEKCKECGRELK